MRASRERRAMIEEMQPLYRRCDLLRDGERLTSAAARCARSAGLLAAAELHLAVQLHRRPGAGTAVRLLQRRLAAVRCRSPAGRTEDALVLRVGYAYEMATGILPAPAGYKARRDTGRA